MSNKPAAVVDLGDKSVCSWTIDRLACALPQTIFVNETEVDFNRHPWAAQARLGAKPSEPIQLLDDAGNELAAMQIMHLPGGCSGVRSLDIDMVCLALCGSERQMGQRNEQGGDFHIAASAHCSSDPGTRLSPS